MRCEVEQLKARVKFIPTGVPLSKEDAFLLMHGLLWSSTCHPLGGSRWSILHCRTKPFTEEDRSYLLKDLGLYIKPPLTKQDCM